jgi:hypothetical protein
MIVGDALAWITHRTGYVFGAKSGLDARNAAFSAGVSTLARGRRATRGVGLA